MGDQLARMLLAGKVHDGDTVLVDQTGGEHLELSAWASDQIVSDNPDVSVDNVTEDKWTITGLPSLSKAVSEADEGSSGWRASLYWLSSEEESLFATMVLNFIRGGPVTGRFAPTPSGRMHIGNVYAMLGAWLSAARVATAC